jgi:hypothetical protein
MFLYRVQDRDMFLYRVQDRDMFIYRVQDRDMFLYRFQYRDMFLYRVQDRDMFLYKVQDRDMSLYIKHLLVYPVHGSWCTAQVPQYNKATMDMVCGVDAYNPHLKQEWFGLRSQSILYQLNTIGGEFRGYMLMFHT